MLLEILRPLEGLAAKLTLVRLEGHMDSDVRCDVVALDRGGAARIPLASEAQIVGALASNMALADMVLMFSQYNTLSRDEDVAGVMSVMSG